MKSAKKIQRGVSRLPLCCVEEIEHHPKRVWGWVGMAGQLGPLGPSRLPWDGGNEQRRSGRVVGEVVGGGAHPAVTRASRESGRPPKSSNSESCVWPLEAESGGIAVGCKLQVRAMGGAARAEGRGSRHVVGGSSVTL